MIVSWLEKYNKALLTVKSNLQRSSAPSQVKELGQRIIPIIGTYKRKVNWFAQAYSRYKIGTDRHIKKLSKEQQVPYIIVNGKKIYSVIVFTSLMEKVEYGFLKEIVAHEFAHLIDNHIRGKYIDGWYLVHQYCTHDDTWKKLVKWSGGSGMETYDISNRNMCHFDKVPSSHVKKTVLWTLTK